MKNLLTAGVIGLGVGEHHISGLLQHGSCSEIRIWDLDQEKIEEMCRRYPSVIPCDREEQIIGNTSIDLVSICSYDDVHYRQVLSAISAGQHVFVEKPLCLYRPQLKQIQSALTNKPEVKLSSNLVLRTNPRFKEMKKRLTVGEYGDIYYIEADYYWGRDHKLIGWRAEIEYYSIILGAAVHMIDLVIWLTGELPVDVQVMGNNISTRHSRQKFDCFVVLMLRFPSGLIAKISGNGGCVHPHFHGLKIFGTNSTAVHELNSAYSIGRLGNEYPIKEIKGSYPAKESRSNVIKSFVDYILDTSSEPVVSEKSLFDVMSICFSAEDALQSGQTEKIIY